MVELKRYTIVVIILMSGTMVGDQALTKNHQNILDRFLNDFVDSNGKVDYNGISSSFTDIDLYFDFIEKISPNTNPNLFSEPNAEKAFWINAYNALVIKTMLEFPTISSIRDIPFYKGVFWKKRFIIGGQKLSLNDIEHGILRKKFKDPRIHFAINCASISCPPLHNNIYKAKNLDTLLEEKAFSFINDTNNVKINHKQETIHVSKIFKWFKNDFIHSSKSIQNYIYKYKASKDKRILRYRVRFLNYSWESNKKY